MDKSWIGWGRNTVQYREGLNRFLDYAFDRASVGGRILCPCKSCKHKKWLTRVDVFDHLTMRQFPADYIRWIWHGEDDILQASCSATHVTETNPNSMETPPNAIDEMLHDAFGVGYPENDNGDGDGTNHDNVSNDEEVLSERMESATTEFYNLLHDGNESLYDGCTKFTKLSFLLHLYHIKCMCRLTDTAMRMIIKLLKDAFPHAKVPDCFDKAKKTINKLGLRYTNIHACPNDCMLYWEDDANREICKKCNTSRWKEVLIGQNRKKKPAKILRYFPLKQRLQRLFMSSKTVEHMRWHATRGSEDGIMRHPRDSKAWKSFDTTYPDFALDPRNVRLGLASDGFNPFGNMSTNHSIWPVILIPYNLPPWMCMKQTSFILSMVIPGPKMPGNDIDVYLQPLIKELQELWLDGVDTFDVSIGQNFKMRAALMWTISDFPGLSTLSGWNTHTGLACPNCNFDANPLRLPYSRKWCFWGHRRFLQPHHRFRLMRLRFDGTQEFRNPPTILSGTEILQQVEGIDIAFGKSIEIEVKGKRARGKNYEIEPKQWKKKSIFFNLPYWQTNLLRHNLDVMHIEKNVCDNILYTLLNDSGRTKDHLKARRDLKAMGIREELWPDDNGKFPPCLFTMTNPMKDVFFKCLKEIKMPDGYSSNISRCIDLKQRKIFGLKSHDCHILMQQLLSIAIRYVLPDKVTTVLVELSSFFKQLCSKSVNLFDLDNVQNRIVLTLCHLEMLFPPSFFTVMVHLCVHLVQELRLGGPVQYRWMYPIERYLCHMKSYVRNRAQLEGSIAEGYISEECLNFCSRYLDGIETRFNHSPRVDDRPSENCSHSVSTIFPYMGRPVGSASYFALTPFEKLQAHRYVLFNCVEVNPYVEQFRLQTKRRLRGRKQSSIEIERIVVKEFATWFSRRVFMDDMAANVSNDLKLLAQGPHDTARRFSAFNVNGLHFRTLAREQGAKTQNSGVFMTSTTQCVSSFQDANGQEVDLPYYGKLVDIIELNYYGKYITLFKCIWVDTTNVRGLVQDPWGFHMVNFNRLIHTGEREEHDPYIYASQAQMVYYIQDQQSLDWSVVVHIKPRDVYDLGGELSDEIYDHVPLSQQVLSNFFEGDGENIQLAREVVEDDALDSTNINNFEEDENALE